MPNKLFDGDTFERKGYTFKVEFPRDNFMGEPWKEHDGHGIISEWTSRSKAPGERVLAADRSHWRYYDFAASMRLARKDGWGCRHGRHIATLRNPPTTAEDQVYWHGHTSKGSALACAVEQDFEHLRQWCADQWEWISVVVTLLDENGDETDERESLSGIESNSGEYLTEVAHELADEILSRVEVDEPLVQVSEN